MDLNRVVDKYKPKMAMLLLHSSDVEGHYLFWAARELHHSHVDIRRARMSFTYLEMIDEAESIANDAATKSSDYDEVWCILVGSHPNAEVIEYAAQRNVRIAYAWPDFDTWIRFHFDADEQTVNPGQPGDLSRVIAGKYMVARANAIEFGTGGDRGATIHEVVDSMRQSLRDFEGESDLRDF